MGVANKPLEPAGARIASSVLSITELPFSLNLGDHVV